MKYGASLQVRKTSALPRLIMAAAVSYAALSLVAQWRFSDVVWRGASPIEIFTDLLALATFGFAALQIWRNRHDGALRRAWISATCGTALIAAGETTDWFKGMTSGWGDALPYEIGLWLLAALLIYRCTRRYPLHRHVRYWLLAGFAVQLLANATEIAEDSAAIIPLGQLGAVQLTIEYTELLSLLCYASALVFTQLGPRLMTALSRYMLADRPATLTRSVLAAAPAQSVEIGRIARGEFHGGHMFRKARYPTPYRLLHRPVLRQLVSAGMIALFAATAAARVRTVCGMAMRRQLANLWRFSFRHEIDAVTYYLMELYRPEMESDAGYYLTRYETKNGLFTLINRLRGKAAGVPHDMTDKLAFADACAGLGVSTPPVLAAIEAGSIDWRARRAAMDCDLFVKLRSGRGTKSTERLVRIGPYRYVDRRGREIGLDDAMEKLRRRTAADGDRAGTALIVQPHLRNHAALADLADQSLIAIRIVTCLNEQGEPEVTHGMLRVLAKIEPGWDARPNTEYGAAIDVRSGVLGAMTGDSPSTCLEWYGRHPMTGAPVMGRKLPQWDGLCDLALKAHRGFSGRIVVGWDMALTDEGAVVLEGNANMDVSFIQRGYRQGIGRSRLGELLAHHLAALVERRRGPVA